MFNFVLLRYLLMFFAFNYIGIRGLDTNPENTSCPPGYFGLECINKCPKTCNVSCDVVGQCNSCSLSGFRLPLCDHKCHESTYGLNCFNKCSEKCFQEKCDAVTGQCFQCNQVGMRLPNCTQKCAPGSYGLNCLHRCPLVCQNACDHINGSCSYCPVGRDQQCSVNCAEKYNKEICQLFCPDKCLTWCNVTNSHCSLCASGYNPPFCNTSCDFTRFGINCKNICSNRCKDGRCDPVTGACFSCIDGYVGRKCNGQCIKGYYGQDCDLACPETCVNESCDFVTGNCYECQAGYTGQHCHQLCETGKYGRNCLHSCSANCLKTCDPRSGMCWQCMPGYRDTYCNITCQDGSYGNGCKEMCPLDCICDHITGKCKDCNSDNIGPGCKPSTSNTIHTRNILVLFLYTLGGMFIIIVVLSSIMWLYKKKVNLFWRKARQSRNSEIDDFNNVIGEHCEMDSLNQYEKEENSLEAANAESEKHKKLANYLRNHGKTYTPKEYDKTELRIQYLKQIKTHTPSTLNYALKSCKNCATEGIILPQLNVSISHTTVLDSDEISNHSYIEPKDVRKYNLATLINTSYSYPRQSYRADKDDTASLKKISRMKYLKDQHLTKSQLVSNKMDKSRVCGILESSQLFVLGGSNKELTNTFTCTNDTRSKLSESLQLVKNRSMFMDQDGASADSLYGITSQEFVQDQYINEGSNSIGARISKKNDLFPLDISIENALNNVTSKQTCSNKGPVVVEKALCSLFGHNDMKKPCSGLEHYNDLEVITSNESTCVNKSSLVNHTGFKSDLFPDYSLPSSYNHSDDKIQIINQDSRKIETSSIRRSFIDIKNDKNEPLSDSTLSDIDQESCLEECSTFSDSRVLPLDTLSESFQEDIDHFNELQDINTFKKKNKKSAVKKKYRKVSPPKCENKVIAVKDQLKKETEALEHSRSTFCQLDIQSIAKQPSVARLSTSATVKGDSPRLVRCATTRQLSPMYAVRSAAVNHLKPLPTPPPDGKLSLKPVEKLSSSSSILEQTKDK